MKNLKVMVAFIVVFSANFMFAELVEEDVMKCFNTQNKVLGVNEEGFIFDDVLTFNEEGDIFLCKGENYRETMYNWMEIETSSSIRKSECLFEKDCKTCKAEIIHCHTFVRSVDYNMNGRFEKAEIVDVNEFSICSLEVVEEKFGCTEEVSPNEEQLTETFLSSLHNEFLAKSSQEESLPVPEPKKEENKEPFFSAMAIVVVNKSSHKNREERTEK